MSALLIYVSKLRCSNFAGSPLELFLKWHEVEDESVRMIDLFREIITKGYF